MLDIVEIIAYEKGLSIENVQQILRDEILKLAKNCIDENRDFVVDFDKKDKSIRLFYKLKVTSDDDSALELEPKRYIALSKAQNSGSVSVGDEILFEMNIDNLDLSRSAISALLSDFESSVEKSAENEIFEQLRSHINKIVNGMVVYIDEKSQDTIVELESIKAKLPRKNRIKGESFKVAQHISCILKHIYIDKRYGIQIELSRTTPRFLEELLRLEVPEIADGVVSIMACARIPGVRAKVAVMSNSPRVDALGATVGVKGVRINAVSKKICGESIDCVEYSTSVENFIKNAISPAKILGVKVQEQRATISLYSDQKPKAIGREGVNIRLASMLVGLELEIEDVGENPALDVATQSAAMWQSQLSSQPSETAPLAANAESSENKNAKELLDSLFKD